MQEISTMNMEDVAMIGHPQRSTSGSENKVEIYYKQNHLKGINL